MYRPVCTSTDCTLTRACRQYCTCCLRHDNAMFCNLSGLQVMQCVALEVLSKPLGFWHKYYKKDYFLTTVVRGPDWLPVVACSWCGPTCVCCLPTNCPYHMIVKPQSCHGCHLDYGWTFANSVTEFWEYSGDWEKVTVTNVVVRRPKRSVMWIHTFNVRWK